MQVQGNCFLGLGQCGGVCGLLMGCALGLEIGQLYLAAFGKLPYGAL